MIIVLYKVSTERLQVSGRRKTKEDGDVSVGTSVSRRERVELFTRGILNKIQTKKKSTSSTLEKRKKRKKQKIPPTPLPRDRCEGTPCCRHRYLTHVRGVKWSKGLQMLTNKRIHHHVSVSIVCKTKQKAAKTGFHCSFKAEVTWRWRRSSRWYIDIYIYICF